jgi:ABC-type glycerol-3-phosphate transport system substrate-binding protein
MTLDRNAFTAGKLAMYIGFQSEEQGIRDENPNLSYGIVRVPQGEGTTAQRNYGTFYGLGIVKASTNRVGAYMAAMRVAAPDLVPNITSALDITPVQRSLFGLGNDNLYGQIFEDSALISRGWLDPRPRETNGVFKAMVEEITFGRGDAVEAVGDAVTSLDELYK